MLGQGLEGAVSDVAAQSQRTYVTEDWKIWSVHIAIFVVVALICGGLFYLIFEVRSAEFAGVILGQHKDIGLAAARQYAEGFLEKTSIVYSKCSFFIALIFMWLIWLDLGSYLCSTKDGAASPSTSYSRARSAMHDPPGDIFTLVGVAFTFVGLAVSLVTLPLDTIYSALTPNSMPPAPSDTPLNDTALPILAAAIVFGSSLAIGLLSSFMGITLAVLARRMAASYSVAVRSPAELSKDFEYLKKLAVMGNIDDKVKSIHDALEEQAKKEQAKSDGESVDATTKYAEKIRNELAGFVEEVEEEVAQDARSTSKPGTQNVALIRAVAGVMSKVAKQLPTHLRKAYDTEIARRKRKRPKSPVDKKSEPESGDGSGNKSE